MTTQEKPLQGEIVELPEAPGPTPGQTPVGQSIWSPEVRPEHGWLDVMKDVKPNGDVL